MGVEEKIIEMLSKEGIRQKVFDDVELHLVNLFGDKSKYNLSSRQEFSKFLGRKGYLDEEYAVLIGMYKIEEQDGDYITSYIAPAAGVYDIKNKKYDFFWGKKKKYDSYNRFFGNTVSTTEIAKKKLYHIKNVRRDGAQLEFDLADSEGENVHNTWKISLDFGAMKIKREDKKYSKTERAKHNYIRVDDEFPATYDFDSGMYEDD